MMLCRNYSIAQALKLYKPPDLITGHGGFCYAVFCDFVAQNYDVSCY